MSPSFRAPNPLEVPDRVAVSQALWGPRASQVFNPREAGGRGRGRDIGGGNGAGGHGPMQVAVPMA